MIELWDIKTSDKVWPENYIQLAAYRHLAELNLNITPSARIILITKGEKFSAPYVPESVIDQAWEVWKPLVKVYKNMNQLKGILKDL